MSDHFNNPNSIAESLSDLLGRSTAVAPLNFEANGSPVTVAVYAPPEQNTTAVCVCDIALSNFAGAALSMIPAGFAKECVSSNEMPDNTLENLREIYNIGARWFDHPDKPSVRLTQAELHTEGVPDDVTALLSHATSRQEISVQIDGYGVGRMLMARID